jgi:glutamate 5-kinase
MSLLKDHKRIVVKIGSNVIASHGKGLYEARMEAISAEIAGAILNAKQPPEFLLVSSGAILCGIEKLGWSHKAKTLPIKQAAASVGQSHLMWTYERLFSQHHINVAQILLTKEDIANRKRFLNARNTLMTLLANKVLPIINENDTVATQEIQFGDNDALAGQVALLVDASLLIILSDVDGLFTGDPRRDKTAQRIPVVDAVTAKIEKMAGNKGLAGGTGGMASKVATAKSVALFGVTTIIINGTTPGALTGLFQGEQTGTLFLPNTNKRTSKKHWIADGLKTKGTLTLDAGATEAILKKGKSLLPSGVVSVEGIFREGDAVSCQSPTGAIIAKGLTHYNASDIIKIRGAHSSQIETILGYKSADEVIHRDNLVLYDES